MNREQLIEKAARASHQWGLDFGGEWAGWDELRESTRREYREEASAVVDALLPQVTTAEELRHLLIRVSQEASPAVVVDNLGRTWTLFENDRGDWWAHRLGDQDEPESVSTMLNLDEDFDGDDLDAEPWQWLLPGPLTVVWQP